MYRYMCVYVQRQTLCKYLHVVKINGVAARNKNPQRKRLDKDDVELQ